MIPSNITDTIPRTLNINTIMSIAIVVVLNITRCDTTCTHDRMHVRSNMCIHVSMIVILTSTIASAHNVSSNINDPYNYDF